MKILKTLLVIIVILAGAITGIYAWLGGFSTVAVNRGEIGPWEIVYSTHKGPYKNLNKSWTKFQKDWEAAGLKVCNSLAVYLDMPGTPEDQLRSAIACRIDELAPQCFTDQQEHLIVYCHHGMRSLRVAQWLRHNGFVNTQSMRGGIDAWADLVEPDMARY